LKKTACQHRSDKQIDQRDDVAPKTEPPRTGDDQDKHADGYQVKHC